MGRSLHRIMVFLAAGLMLSAIASSWSSANEFVSGNSNLVVSVDAQGADSEMVISIKNDSNQSISFLSWGTPFESELQADVFNVTTTSKGWPLENRASYIGYKVKRGEPDASAYITLEPGAILTRRIDLAQSYAATSRGSYKVEYQQDLLLSESGGIPANDSTPRSGLSKTATHKVASVAAATTVTMIPVAQDTTRFIQPAYSGCSASQQSTIESSLGSSESLLDDTFERLSGFSADDLNASPRYRTWFGAYSASRHNRVMSTFSNMVDAFDEELMTFDCRCIRDNRDVLFGYIRRDMPWLVNVCPLFFDKEEEQVTTIVHELAHFNEIGPIDDHVYGTGPSQLLATNQPNLAIDNADNYGYFIANNVPPLALDPVEGGIDIPDETPEPGTSPVAAEFEFVQLTVGQSISGDVAESTADFFVVSGVTEFELETLQGDADLYIFTDSSLQNQICVSELITAIDSCVIDRPQTLFVVVFGFESSSYTFSTSGFETENNLINLVAGESVGGLLLEGDSSYYVVSDVESITLESLSGDADLYVFDSENLDADSLICESFLFTSESAVDNCRVPEDARVFIRVYGYVDSEFTLVASKGDSLQGESQITTLALGETFEGSVAVDEFVVFSVEGAGQLDLVSGSGDADLIVFLQPDFENPYCISEEFSQTSALDSCELEQGVYGVAVYGFSASDFSLTFASRDGEPVNVTTNPPLVDSLVDSGDTGGGGGGGGGSAGWLLLVVLLAFRYVLSPVSGTKRLHQ